MRILDFELNLTEFRVQMNLTPKSSSDSNGLHMPSGSLKTWASVSHRGFKLP